jgi:hypothetical protein
MIQSQPSSDGLARRGIVICGGGKRYFICASVLVSLLRHHGCRLPIELWHRGPGELDLGMADLIAEKGVTVRDAAAILAPGLADTVETLRLGAIAASAFDVVLSLDADCAPLVDLTGLFDWPGLVEHGLLMFPDRGALGEDHAIWAAAGLSPRTTPSVDPGLVVIDRLRHGGLIADAIRLAQALAPSHRPGRRPVFALLLAALADGQEVALGSHAPFEVEFDLIHRDVQGEAMVQHRRTSKWNLGGHDREMPTAESTQVALQALTDLGARWSGTIFRAPADAAEALQDELIATRRFLYESGNGRWRELTLHRGGRIGAGRADFEQHWAVVERDGAPVLQFYSDIRLTIEFQRLPDGTWRGACCGPPGFTTRLAAYDTPGLTVAPP